MYPAPTLPIGGTSFSFGSLLTRTNILIALAVIALIGLTLALYFVVKSSENSEVQKIFGGYIKILLIIELLQGAIGYVQYFTGLPALIVGAHLLGAVLVWISAWRINLTGRVAKKVVI